MINKNPKVSVLMAVYNTDKKYLKEAIESILNQTYSDFEFIILNDGSTDGSENIILSYKDERIKYLKHDKNQGIPKTRNDLLNAATGEYIANMDSDDVSLPNRLKIQVDYMDKHQEIGVLGSAFHVFQKREEDVLMPLEDKDVKKMLLKGLSPFANPTVMIRKSIFGDIKYDKDFNYSEDYKLWCDLESKTKFANLPDILVKYRWHGKNISKQKTIEQSIQSQTIIFLNIEKYFNKDCSKEFEILNKIKEGKKISAKEYKILFEKEKLIAANHMFKKIARQNCLNPFIALGILR